MTGRSPWSPWYVAWKSGINSYWLSGLSNEQISKITDGNFIEYPHNVFISSKPLEHLSVYPSILMQFK